MQRRVRSAHLTSAHLTSPHLTSPQLGSAQLSVTAAAVAYNVAPQHVRGHAILDGTGGDQGDELRRQGRHLVARHHRESPTRIQYSHDMQRTTYNMQRITRNAPNIQLIVALHRTLSPTRRITRAATSHPSCAIAAPERCALTAAIARGAAAAAAGDRDGDGRAATRGAAPDARAVLHPEESAATARTEILTAAARLCQRVPTDGRTQGKRAIHATVLCSAHRFRH